MFRFDKWDSSQPLAMSLVRPDGERLCELNGVDTSTASITLNVNNQYELYFDYYRFIDENGILVESNGYQQLSVEMRILVEGIGLFRLVYPPYEYDGNIEKKRIEAYSIDSELEDKELFEFKINTGEEDSLEYLVTLDENETEPLINEYTGLPYDYIVLHNTYAQQLEEIQGKYADGIHTDKKEIEELETLCHQIPRLGSVVLEDANGVPYTQEFVSFTSNDNGEITSMTLTNFEQRLEKLINFYNEYGDQLSVIDLAIEKCNTTWSVGEIDRDLCNKKLTFDVSENIYAFLTQDVAEAAQCVFSFDLFKMQILATSIDDLGIDSNVVLARDTLQNTLSVTCDDNRLVTRYNVDSDSVNIIYYNFGRTDIDNLSYFLNARDDNGDLIYMSEELASKYKQFVEDRDKARDLYADLTKQYNQLTIDIDEINYRVPNDIVKMDYTTYTNTELEETKRGYYNLYMSLIMMYQADYGDEGFESDRVTIKEDFIKTTPYYNDYFAYIQAMEQVDRVLYDRHSASTKDMTDEEKARTIERYKTEWQLYGISELGAKEQAYINKLQVMIDGGAIVGKYYYEMWTAMTDDERAKYASEAAYNATPPTKWQNLSASVQTTYDNWEDAYRYAPKTWSELSANEKQAYGSMSDNYYYPTYYQNYDEMRQCHRYMVQLQEQVAELEERQEAIAEQRRKLVALVTLDDYDREELGKLIELDQDVENFTFTDREIATIKRLYIDGTYENENILTTNLDNIVSEVDISKELYNDAMEDLSIMSQPQLSITTTMDNILAMKEFEGFLFLPGNYVYVEYFDNYYIKLRLASITFNPKVPTSEIDVTFTNFINSASKRSDLTYLLNLSSSRGNVTRSSGGSGSGGAAGGYGTDLDINISNKMLTKLLSSEKFDTKVADVITSTIRVNEITARYANFDGLAVGSTKVDGRCITTGWIVSTNYNGNKDTGTTDNTAGTILNLDNGKFNFGGGKLTYDGSNLSVNGAITATSLTLGNDVKIPYGSVSGTPDLTVYIAKNGTVGKTPSASTTGFVVSSAGLLQAGNAVIYGTIYASAGTIGGLTIDSSSIHTTNVPVTSNADNSVALSSVNFTRTVAGASRSGLRLAIGSNFGVTNSGVVYASNMNASGTITTNNLTATGGSIGSFTINNALYTNNKSSLGHANAGVYVGSDGISCGANSPFKVTSAGVLTASGCNLSSAKVSGDITASTLTANKAVAVIPENLIEGGSVNPASFTFNAVSAKLTADSGVRMYLADSSVTTVVQGVIEFNSDTYVHDISKETTKLVLYNDNNEVDMRSTSNAGLYHMGQSTDWDHGRGYDTNGWLIYIQQNGTITVNTKSDRRLKNIYGEMEYDEAIPILRDINIVNYSYKADAKGIVQNGVVAQQIRDTLIQHNIGYRPYLTIESNETDETFDDIYTPEEDVIYGIDYSKFTPILWRGWQYHDVEINKLIQQNEFLKNEIKELKKALKG